MSVSNRFAITFYFKEIYPTLADFIDFITDYTTLDNTDEHHAYLYKMLYNHYANSNIAYDTVDAFNRHFAVTYENIFEQFKFRTDKVKKLYDLADDELNVIQYGIQNVGLNDNSKLENALDNVVPFVSSQTSDKTRANVFVSYLTAVRDIADKYLQDFIDKFRSHFLCIFGIEIPIYTNVENEEEQ